VNDATIHQHDATNRFVMIKPDQSAVSPLIYRNSLAEVPAPGGTTPAKWRVRTLISQRPAGSDNIDLQLYATSFGTPSGTQPLVHDFLGQVRLNTLQPGVPTDVDIPLNQSLINRAFGGSAVRLEYTVQTPNAYARRVGIGAQSIVGNKTIIPVGSRAPFCPRPAPDNNITLVTAPNPTFTAGVTPTNPIVTFPLSTGLNATVPPRLIELLPIIR